MANVPSLELAAQFSRLLDGETLAYLASRGVSEAVARKHWLGKRYGKMLTIPNIVTVNDQSRSYGIKWRWLPRYQPAGDPKYRMLPGSIPKSLYNYDILSQHWPFVVIVESLLDVLMLETLGIPAVAPFGGGSVWGESWGRFFDCDVIINVADRDEPRTRPDGSTWKPGEYYAERRAFMLGLCDEYHPIYTRVVTTTPPGSADDLTSAHQSGIDVCHYIHSLVRGRGSL